MTKPETGPGGDNWCPFGQGFDLWDIWCYLFGHKLEVKVKYIPFAYGYSSSGITYKWEECKRCGARTIQEEI